MVEAKEALDTDEVVDRQLGKRDRVVDIGHVDSPDFTGHVHHALVLGKNLEHRLVGVGIVDGEEAIAVTMLSKADPRNLVLVAGGVAVEAGAEVTVSNLVHHVMDVVCGLRNERTFQGSQMYILQRTVEAKLHSITILTQFANKVNL